MTKNDANTNRLRSLTLAMEEVLRGRGWMALEDVASEISARDLWRRPSDGGAAVRQQVRARAEWNHGRNLDKFEVHEGRIRLR